MEQAIALLKQLIATPSTSRNEADTATIIYNHLKEAGIDTVERLHNNVYARSAQWHDDKPVLLLNSHHDTVKPAASWTRDPFTPTVEGDRLYGLGSNDAGASAVSLITTFKRYYNEVLPFNLLLAISAEEEVTGEHGIRALLPTLGRIDMAVVGEPTLLQAAVGERGLVVLDCVAHGRRGHAARNEGINALYIAMDDINAMRSYQPGKVSSLLGPIKFTTTMIECGTQHNVVPDECKWVMDIRTTDAYTNEETIELVRSVVKSDVKERSTRIRASAIDESHPLVATAVELGSKAFVSPTTSDMSQMAFPSLKLGPGDSARSHTADEYINLSEIEQGIDFYTRFIARLAEKY